MGEMPHSKIVSIHAGPVWAKIAGPVEALKLAQQALTVEVPGAQHIPTVRAHLWDGKHRFLRKGTSTFPAGLSDRVTKLLREEGFSVQNNDLPSIAVHPDDVKSCLNGITLRDYQIETVLNALMATRLAIQCPTGSGKTEIGAAIIQQVKKPTLWLVHRKELLHQTAERLSQRLMDGGLVGKFGAGLSETKTVTVGMIQSLKNIHANDRFWGLWKVLIVDEVHHLSADTWYKLVNRLEQAYYRFGLSGTVVTGNAVRDLKLEGATGPVYVGRTTMDLAEAGYLAKPLIMLLDVGRLSYPSYEEIRQAVCPTWRDDPRQLSNLGGKLFGYALRKGIVENIERTGAIVQTATRYSKVGQKVLVLCSRLAHGKRILQEIDKVRWDKDVRKFRCWWLHGDEDDSIRQRVLQEFRDEKAGAILIASTIFDEGVDIPEIDILILAGGGESYIKSIQRVGRALRKRPDKDIVMIFDFLDGRDPTHKKDYLANHTKARVKDYKAQGFDVRRAVYSRNALHSEKIK